MIQKLRLFAPLILTLVLALGAAAPARAADSPVQENTCCTCICDQPASADPAIPPADPEITEAPMTGTVDVEQVALPAERTETTDQTTDPVTGSSADIPAAPVTDADDLIPPTAGQPPMTPTLRISELLPDPAGKDADGEFIELENFGPSDAGLDDCELAVPGKYRFSLADHAVVAPGFVLLAYAETRISLVNDGATVVLNCSGRTLATATYSGPAREGWSYALGDGNEWAWTSVPTPGQPNQFPALPKASATGGTTDPTTEVADPVTTPAAVTSVAATMETTATETALPTAISAAQAADPYLIKINEFLPDPAGSDDSEWIELRNDGAAEVTLAGWTLDDAEGGSSPFRLGEQHRIAGGGLLVIAKSASRLALNNDGDSIRLFDGSEKLIASAVYPPAKEGRSFAWTGADWAWMEPSPGLANAPTPAPATVTVIDGESIDSRDATGVMTEETTFTVAELPELSAGDEVAVRGLVNLAPGISAKTIFGIQDADGAAGISVRIFGQAFPELAFGDEVELRGRLAASAAGIRLNVPGRTGIAVVARGKDYSPRPIELAEAADLTGPLFIETSGEISKTGANTFRIFDESGENEILVRALRPRPAAWPDVGSRVKILGILRRTGNTPEILLREPPQALNAAPAETTGTPSMTREPLTIDLPAVETARRTATAEFFLPAAFSMAAAAAAGAWLILKRRRNGLVEQAAGGVDK